jgi:FkbM family methyltransferase
MRSLRETATDLLLHLSGTLPEEQRRPELDRLLHVFAKVLPQGDLRERLKGLVRRFGAARVAEVACEAVIRGDRIVMIDDRCFDYYSKFSQGNIHEPALSRHLHDLLRRPDLGTFVDIGAHYGYFTILAARALGPGGRVVSFEPHPAFHRRLLRNIELNELSAEVTTYQIALAAHSGTAVMGGWDERVPMASDGGNVRVMPFDDVCEEQGIRPDVVKIDVFGAEGDVLRGMKKALRDGVSHLFCELHQHMRGVTVAELVSLLEESGLRVFEFAGHREEDGGQVRPLGPEFFADFDDKMLYATRAAP